MQVGPGCCALVRIRKRRVQSHGSHGPKCKESPLPLARVTAFCNGTQEVSPRVGPLPRVLTQATPAPPNRKLSLRAVSPWKGRVTLGVTQMPTIPCCPRTFREEALLYRSLCFPVCIQGHFLGKSIAPPEYTIFMSWCILEFKYKKREQEPGFEEVVAE